MGSQQMQAGFSMSAALASFPGMHPAVGYASSASASYFGAALASTAGVTTSSSVVPSVVVSSMDPTAYSLGEKNLFDTNRLVVHSVVTLKYQLDKSPYKSPYKVNKLIFLHRCCMSVTLKVVLKHVKTSA